MQTPNQAGLTLIEVLIALAIVAIAMTAIIQNTSQNIQGTTYLQEKTVAAWVALEVMNQARIGLLSVPEDPAKLEQETTMFGQTWFWEAYEKGTPNERIKEVEVDVSKVKEGSPLASLIGYISAAPRSSG